VCGAGVLLARGISFNVTGAVSVIWVNRRTTSDVRTTLHSFLSQAELAAALAVSRQTVISIENGRYMPSLPLAFRIARFFDVPVDKMFTPEDKDLGA
jgi:putative transcriptional regulator